MPNRFLTMIALAAVAACSSDDPPPPATLEDVAAACRAFDEAVCTNWGACLGWTQDQIDACITDGLRDCVPEGDYCWNAQVAALDGCAERYGSESCEDACTDSGFCYAPCYYSCPPPSEP